ncbi:RNA polymerase sigma factor [Dactylosporangium sp. NPDC051485]|uniref:RNA polymerase sigma factor n=1 Tax=Dactylosporangium sp. NPDC051485 TaxID=3154846 RepID=UPI00342D4385
MTADLAAAVRAAQAGDTMAMHDLLDALSPYVGRICGPIAYEAAPDAAQEALIAIFRGLRSLRDPAALWGWARAIAVREAVRAARRAHRGVPMDMAALPARDDPELATDVLDVLARLSPEHRAILVLRDVEGLSEQEAAEILNVAEGTVKSRLHRARQSFRKAWSP